MTVSVTMPALGESVTEGTVTRWLKQEGDTVAADEPLVEVSTDKVDTEIPAPSAGVLVKIVAHEDAVVPVGGELAVIGESADAAPPSAPPVEAPAVEAPPVEAPAAEAPAAVADPEPETAPEPTPAPATVTTPAVAAPASSPAPSGQTTSVTLPALGESVTEGTVTRWLKQVGDTVAADEPLVEVSTDKVDTEIPSPVAGVLLSIAAAEDATVPVGAELGVIGSAGSAPAPAAAPSAAPPAAAAAPPAPAAPAAAAPAAPAPAASPAPAAGVAPPAAAAGGETYVTPLVRKLAAEHGIDLASLTGTGVGGRVRKQDVLEAADRKRAEEAAARAAAAAAPTPAAASAAPTAAAATAATPAAAALRGRTEPMSRLRRVIAQRMVESLHVSAQLTSVVEVDVTRVAALRQRAKAGFEAREGVKLSFLPFFAKATVEALRGYPSVNASIDTDAGTVTYHAAEHLGIAVDTERGLLVPVIRDAGDLSLGGLSRKITDLAERTRGNKITPDELSGGTFTLTNTGSRGALFDTPIINQPQVAILGTGAVVKRPVVVTDATTGSDGIAIRSMVFFALTYDHRLVDGAEAARFLVAIKHRLEEGAFESDLGL